MKKPLLFVLAAAIQIIAMLSIAARYSYVETTGDTVYIPAVGFDPRDMFRGDYANVSYGDLVLWTGAVNFDVTQGKRVYVTPEFTASGEIVAIRNVTQSAPDVRYVQAKVASFTYEHPKYGYASELSSSAVPISGTMENEREWISDYSPSASKSENAPQTKFSVWSGAIAALSSTGAVVALYADLNECISEIRYDGTMKPLAAGSPESAANDEDRTATDLCRSFPKVRVTSVTVPRVLRLDYGVDRFFVEENTGHTVEDALRKGGVYAIWKVSGSGKIVLHGLKIGDAVVR